jgi:hypothetical protein
MIEVRGIDKVLVPPRPVTLAGLDSCPGDQSQQPDRFGLLGVQLDPLGLQALVGLCQVGARGCPR